MSPILKKVVRLLKYLFLSMVLLFLLIVGAVNLPFVHTALTKKTNSILAENDIPVNIGNISLLLNGKIAVKEITIIMPPCDTIVYAGETRVDISILPLLSKKLVVNQINLNDAFVNILTDTITGELNIISVFNSKKNKPVKTEEEKLNSSNDNPWEIDAKSVDLKNIRFIYSDSNSGILVKQNLATAEIDFSTFSLQKRQIDIKSIEIDKSFGMVGIWEGKIKTEKDTTTTADWKFSAKNLNISDLNFTLDQPDIEQRIHVALKNGNISVENLDLLSSEILVRDIELDEPKVTLTTNSTVERDTNNQPAPLTVELPKLSWTILSQNINIVDGVIDFKNIAQENTADTSKWFPVHKLNTSFKNTQITPSGYRINLENISFSLAQTLDIESGSFNFASDSLQKMGLNIQLSALLKDKTGWFTGKQHLNFIAKFEGDTSALQINELGLNSTTGVKFNLNGTIQNPLQISPSVCNLQFTTSAVSRKMLIPVVQQFSPETELPEFNPVTLKGNIRNTIFNPVFNIRMNSLSGQIEAMGNFNIQKTQGKLEASFTEILLAELLGDIYPEKITGKILFDGGLNQRNEPDGEVSIEIDSVLYKDKTTYNLALRALAQNNEIDVAMVVIDSALNCNLEGNFGWIDKNNYNGSLIGDIDINLYEMNLVSIPVAGKVNIDAGFSFSPNGITSFADFTNFTISNNKTSVKIDNTEFELNSTDSIIESQLESDFLSINFKSLASFADIKNAFDSTELKTAIKLDSANFINLNEIIKLDKIDLDATLRYDSVFNLFYPDSVLNFSDINLRVNKTGKESIINGTISTNWINFNKIKAYTPQLLVSVEPEQFNFEIKADSVGDKQFKFGKLSLNIDVLPTNIAGDLIVADDNGDLLHKIGFVAEEKNDLVIFKSSIENWIISKNPWTLSPPEFFTWDKTTKSLFASLDLHFEERYIGIKGNSTDSAELILKNIEFNNFALPGLIDVVPEGIIDGNVKYSVSQTKNVDINLEMRKVRWRGINFNLVSAKGFLVADSTGILESDLLITADDSTSVQVQAQSNNVKKEFLLKSKFNKLHFKLFESYINEFASNLHGTSDGEITLDNKKNKTEIDGEIRFKNFGLKVEPLKAWLTIPNNKIELKKNQFIFDNFTVIDSLKRPLTVNGSINFVSSDDIRLNMNVKSSKIQLMNTRESKDAPLYGSIVINSGLNIGGTIDRPTIKGNIELESGTNLTYQLIQDLSVKGSQTDVVFATITDSMEIIYPESTEIRKITKMPMIEATIGINPKSVLNVKIDDLYGVDITISGNGLLNYNMLPNNTTRLNGVYTINSGSCKLKITGWPLKNFNITPGSSFNWNGNIENPELNLEATSKV
ncbi:MAG TPA: translocation/assembly module TamB domain-containing protein, partial [Draconibacterium sp.]|nr:translocation/assembly module TamB domain-containing protein [Draconibacterium sp.]